MENKYFIPDIEDLCIGYECEINNTHGKWESITITFTNSNSFFKTDLAEVCLLVEDKYVRVPYLTKEQIEAEGWKERTLNSNEQALLLFSKNGYDLRIYKDYVYRFSKLIVGAGMMPNWDKVLFEGKCKDINTFRKIIKLLEI